MLQDTTCDVFWDPEGTYLYHTLVDGVAYYKRVYLGNAAGIAYWKERTMWLKKAMAKINVATNEESQPPEWIEYRLQRWLLFCQSDLIEVFGNSRVPLDLRRTVRSVQEHLQEPLTNFGPDFGQIDAPDSF